MDTNFGVRFRASLSKIHQLRWLEIGGAGRNRNTDISAPARARPIEAPRLVSCWVVASEGHWKCAAWQLLSGCGGCLLDEKTVVGVGAERG